MNNPVLISTFFLTLLLMVGQFFFIRASVKDRTEQMQFTADIAPTTLLSQLQTYFTQRAYKITAVDPQKQQITFDGFVRPSWFMAIFLSFLAAVGLFCLGLVLSFVYPTLTPVFLGLSLLSPLAGLFYWKQAGRIEQVYLSVKDQDSGSQPYTVVTVTAHRDELIQLQETLPLTKANPL